MPGRILVRIAKRIRCRQQGTPARERFEDALAHDHRCLVHLLHRRRHPLGTGSRIRRKTTCSNWYHVSDCEASARAISSFIDASSQALELFAAALPSSSDASLGQRMLQ